MLCLIHFSLFSVFRHYRHAAFRYLAIFAAYRSLLLFQMPFFSAAATFRASLRFAAAAIDYFFFSLPCCLLMPARFAYRFARYRCPPALFQSAHDAVFRACRA